MEGTTIVLCTIVHGLRMVRSGGAAPKSGVDWTMTPERWNDSELMGFDMYRCVIEIIEKKHTSGELDVNRSGGVVQSQAVMMTAAAETLMVNSDWGNILKGLPSLELRGTQFHCHLVFTLLVHLNLSLCDFLFFLFESGIPILKQRAGTFMGYNPTWQVPFAPVTIYKAWHKPCTEEVVLKESNKVINKKSLKVKPNQCMMDSICATLDPGKLVTQYHELPPFTWSLLLVFTTAPNSHRREKVVATCQQPHILEGHSDITGDELDWIKDVDSVLGLFLEIAGTSSHVISRQQLFNKNFMIHATNAAVVALHGINAEAEDLTKKLENQGADIMPTKEDGQKMMGSFEGLVAHFIVAYCPGNKAWKEHAVMIKNVDAMMCENLMCASLESSMLTGSKKGIINTPKSIQEVSGLTEEGWSGKM
ncbi:hypothetical protein BV22DRAFT_1048892 [Leucogyrophana mollusca]|uniref:Uncharacterized protein n=1 Tax=Leucogyrophana mollusca TaxID=85980 RepID=A0ACB8BC88_9AGAM|nr:hypothetical protein BV22DRAFT_1048892 [Leucogyrophana mollusca]